jgi:NAD(P)H dehydrogenase (quinone)
VKGGALRVLVIDGHPDAGRLISSLLDHYVSSLVGDVEVERIAVRDLVFDPNLRRGYGGEQVWEPDLQLVAKAIDACDHLVVGFPMWWGGEPTLLKGLLDRILLPGFAFRYHRDNPFWDRLLAGRSADAIVTMDTPPWYLRLIYGDPVTRRWRQQVLGFCGFKPVRILRFGPTRRGEAVKRIAGWQRRIARAAAGVGALKRPVKLQAPFDAATFAEAIAERKS